MLCRQIFRAGSAAATTLAICLAAPPVCAQAEPRADYDLPAQPLSETLRAIARASGREILFTAELVRGRTAPPLRGKLTIDEAIGAAIAGTGLLAVDRAGAIVIHSGTAPTAETAGQSGAPAGGGTITVTGTRIRGSESPSPVIVSTREELERAGVNDMTGFARILPQNFTGGQNPGVAGGGEQGGQSNINNSTTLNLRGLGPDATLTLVNGRRIAYDALNQGVDIGSIPLLAVERIEIIPDGASALYGSDAVGGVANIILRRDYDGARMLTRIAVPTSGGGVQQQYAAITGTSWSGGGFMAAVDHSRAKPIMHDDRDYTRALHPSGTIIAGYHQTSLAAAAHHRIADGITLEIDALAGHRRALKALPFALDQDVRTFGLFNRPVVHSFAVLPTLRFELGRGWAATASATRGASRTEIYSRFFSNSTERRQILAYENRLTTLEAGAEGPLIDLPGGPARLAVGAGERAMVLDVHNRRLGAAGTVVTRDFTEPRKVRFAYGELSLPLIGPSNGVAFAHELRLSGALRHERQEGLEPVTTPKVGVVYSPVRDLTVKGSWGRSFKAPTLEQLNQLLAGGVFPADWFLPPSGTSFPPGATVLLLQGGNPDLEPERAESWTATIEARPRFARGLTLQASWFDVDYRDRIAEPIAGIFSALGNPAYRDLVVLDPTAAQVSAIVAELPQDLVNFSGQPYDADQVEAIIMGFLRNTARERVRGVDLAAGYRSDLDDGSSLLLSANASYLKSNRQVTEGVPAIRRAGLLFNPPNWRAHAGGSWEARQLGLSAFVNYVGSVLDTRFPEAERIGPFVTLDLSARYRAGAQEGLLSGLELRLTALNILGERPDTIRNFDPTSPPFDSTNQSPVGRVLSLTIAKSW